MQADISLWSGGYDNIPKDAKSILYIPAKPNGELSQLLVGKMELRSRLTFMRYQTVLRGVKADRLWSVIKWYGMTK